MMQKFAHALLLTLMALAVGMATSMPASAEFGDVVLNKRSDAYGMRPVIFPHWFHRIRFRCKVCHSEFGFEMRAGKNDLWMTDMLEGKFCGLCHNGDVAWGLENCELCHSGKPGMPSGIQGGHATSGPGHW